MGSINQSANLNMTEVEEADRSQSSFSAEDDDKKDEPLLNKSIITSKSQKNLEVPKMMNSFGDGSPDDLKRQSSITDNLKGMMLDNSNENKEISFIS